MNIDQASQNVDLPAKVYPSKRDRWLVGVLWFVIVFSIASMLFVFYTVTSIVSILAQVALFLVIVAFCLSVLRNTYYVLEGDHLLIRSGWFRWRTKFVDIEEVTPSRKAWSSAALSMDRLYVRHRTLRSSSYISPEDKAGFLSDLAARSPDLVQMGDKVVRVNESGVNQEQEGD